MSAHTAYYHVPPYPQHGVPQGWRPPFQGPPPIPAGMDINPQLWQAGRWQPNPAYFAQHQGRLPQHPQQAWIASQAWQQPRAQESRNPYKRVPKPPSAEYLSHGLSDNPLGLSDMVPAEELHAQQQASGDDDGQHNNPASAQSPWVWNPPALDPDDDDQPNSSNNTSSHLRSSSRPPDESARQDTSTPRRSSDHHPGQTKPEDPFTAKRELVPTFSINIVRTPEHYKSSPSRASSRNSQTTRGSLDSQQLTTRMEQLSTSDFPARQASMSDPFKSSGSSEPSQTSYLGSASNLVDEPSNSLLSPLFLTTPKSSSRGIGRHPTFPMVSGPSSLDAIPETSSSDNQQYSSPSRKSRNPARGKTEPIEVYQQQHHHHHHSQHSPTNHSMSNGASPYYNTPSRSSTSPGSSRTSSQHTSPTALTPQSTHDHHSTPPTSGGSRHSNPLPQPPIEHYNGSQKRRVRRGYWNKRGDHLTMSGFIVYAPDDQLYPPELHDYPEASVAYRDEKSQVVNFLQRPEHPDSRPRHGQPSVRPYSSFIEYV